MSKRKTKKRLFKKAFFTCAVLFIAAVLTFNVTLTAYKTAYPIKYSDIIESTAEKTGLDKALLYALIKAESSFESDAVSEAGAKGLTQITPETFSWLQTKTGEEYSEDALFEPSVSVYYGAWFLKYLLDEFGNEKTALAAYHAGRGIVSEWLSDTRYSSDGVTLDSIPYKDTAAYTDRVVKIKNIYKNLYDM